MRKVLRTQQLYIDLPTPGSEPWLNIIVQYVEMKDDLSDAMNVVDRWGTVNARVSSMAANMYPLFDPMPHVAGQISGIGIVNALSTAVIELIIAKYGGIFDPVSGFILMEG